MTTLAEGTLLRSARERAGLSQRALARRAGVPPTTVIRIEKGDVEPTTRTLRSLLAAAGQELELGARPAQIPLLASLVNAHEPDMDGDREPDWTRFRAFLDFLTQHPELRGPATLTAPEPSGSERIDNLLAAIAEKLSDDAGLDRPAWTRRIRPLRIQWLPDGTPRMIQREMETTPIQFSRRGIWLGAENLWRRALTSNDA